MLAYNRTLDVCSDAFEMDKTAVCGVQTTAHISGNHNPLTTAEPYTVINLRVV